MTHKILSISPTTVTVGSHYQGKKFHQRFNSQQTIFIRLHPLLLSRSHFSILIPLPFSIAPHPYLSLSLSRRAFTMATVLRTAPLRAPLAPFHSTMTSSSRKPLCVSFRRSNGAKSSRTRSSLLFSCPPAPRFVKFVPFASYGETEAAETEEELLEPQVEVFISLYFYSVLCVGRGLVQFFKAQFGCRESARLIDIVNFQVDSVLLLVLKLRQWKKFCGIVHFAITRLA